LLLLAAAFCCCCCCFCCLLLLAAAAAAAVHQVVMWLGSAVSAPEATGTARPAGPDAGCPWRRPFCISAGVQQQ
jgi:hypothetical protein